MKKKERKTNQKTLMYWTVVLSSGKPEVVCQSILTLNPTFSLQYWQKPVILQRIKDYVSSWKSQLDLLS